MPFAFYPRHEDARAHVGHCPHLAGAALATVVLAANDNQLHLDLLHGELQAARQSVTSLLAEVESLQQQLAQVKLELRLERQSKFMTSQQERAGDKEDGPPAAGVPGDVGPTPGKRGAPVGHPGWFRATPTVFDQTIEVAAPARKKGDLSPAGVRANEFMTVWISLRPAWRASWCLGGLVRPSGTTCGESRTKSPSHEEDPWNQRTKGERVPDSQNLSLRLTALLAGANEFLTVWSPLARRTEDRDGQPPQVGDRGAEA